MTHTLDLGLNNQSKWANHIPQHPTVAVILPAYNEADTIAATIEDFHRALPEATIWVIDNRCSDDTHAIAQSTLERLRCRGGVLTETRPGKGNAVRRAFTDVQADIYVLSDADCTSAAG